MHGSERDFGKSLRIWQITCFRLPLPIPLRDPRIGRGTILRVAFWECRSAADLWFIFPHSVAGPPRHTHAVGFHVRWSRQRKHRVTSVSNGQKCQGQGFEHLWGLSLGSDHLLRGWARPDYQRVLGAAPRSRQNIMTTTTKMNKSLTVWMSGDGTGKQRTTQTTMPIGCKEERLGKKRKPTWKTPGF